MPVTGRVSEYKGVKYSLEKHENPIYNECTFHVLILVDSMSFRSSASTERQAILSAEEMIDRLAEGILPNAPHFQPPI